MKKSFFRISIIAILVLLLLHPSLSLEGAGNGLMLWSAVVLPTLFPFMICSNMIVALDAIALLIRPFKWIIKHVFLLSDEGGYILISGLLCGYPMGARTCSDFLDEGRITRSEGQYLLAVCNQSSPMFLLGFAAAALPPEIPVWCLLLAVYLPVFPLALLAIHTYHVTAKTDDCAKNGNIPAPINPRSFDAMMMDCFEVMIRIGGYIMLFSILVRYIQTISIIPPQLKAVLLSIVEITTGIRQLSQAIPGTACGVFIAMAVAFGGLSGVYQTKSVIKNAGLSIRHYLGWKALHGLLSALFFILLVCIFLLPQAG